MKKLIKSLILVFVAIIFLTGCSSKNIVDISLDDLKDKISSKDTFALYIGNDNCSHCVAYKPTLEKVLKDYNITIYHLDNSKLSESESSELKKYINITGTPTVAFFTKGEEETALNRIVGQTDESTTIERFKTNGYIK